MSLWTWFWAVLLVLTFVLYAGLALVVTVGGFKDVLAMFRNLDLQHGERANDDVEGSS